MRLYFQRLTVALVLLSWGPLWSQALPFTAQSVTLSCVHLYPIQMKYLERHVNFTKASSNLESRTIDQFIKRLDGSKLYLLDKDQKEIQKMLTGVYDKLKSKECQALDKAQALFVKRVNERVAYAKTYLGNKFVFNPKTKIILDPDLRKRAKSEKEQNQFHESYMQYQVASYLASDMKLDEAKQQIVRNYERIQRRVLEFKPTDLLSSYLDSFARALDPHSSFLSADALEDFEIQMRLSLEGIGATLSSQDGFTVIEQLIPGGAADQSGKLKPKDKIVAVAQGKTGEFQNVIEMDLRDVVRLIRGAKGSEVRLKVLRKSAKETNSFEVTLIRDKIKLEDEAAQVHYFEREVGGLKKKVALFNLPSFYSDNRKDGRSASRDLKNLLREANKNGAETAVLDLSSNGGGSLRDAVEIAGLFFATGNVVKQSQRMVTEDEQVGYEVLKDTEESVEWSGPLVVLTSRVSASASEIVSGTLHDYNRAVIVGGDHTFGKGSVQSVEYLLPGLGAIKTTVGMFFTAGGASTQHMGVNADIVFPSVYSVDDIGEKTLDYSLPPKRIKEFISKTAFVPQGKGSWKPINRHLVDQLRKSSIARIAASEGFKKVNEEIAKSKKRGKSIEVGILITDKKSDKKIVDGVPEKSLDGDDGEANLTREERKKKYLERPDIIEAVNVATDLLMAQSGNPGITLGAKDAKIPPIPATVDANKKPSAEKTN